MNAVRWWINTDHEQMAVDNASVSGMDFSALDPDIWMVQWTDGKGEIERQSEDGENLNGLREPFIDVVPYAPLFQQFLTLLKAKALLLPQAKKVQTDLIGTIFESKRQAPFHYAVAAGDYWWDATDETLYASTSAGLQNAIASINAIAARLNSVIPTLITNVSNLETHGNNVRNEINSDVVAYVNSAFGAINTVFGQINNNIVNPGNAIVADYNNALGYYESTLGTGSNTINNKLRFVDQVDPSPDFIPGLVGDIGHSAAVFSYIGSNTHTAAAVDSYFDITPPAWSALPNVTTSNVQWIPIGSSAPVSVTSAEQTAIMNGIAARTNDLAVKKNTKTLAVNALTTVDAVIAYDVTTGW